MAHDARGTLIAHNVPMICTVLALVVVVGNTTETPYRVKRQRIVTNQAKLATEFRRAASDEERRRVLDRARHFLFDAIVDELIPPWIGTPWDFNGMSQTPGQGEIACGYFVSTVLRDAGLRVDRIKLAQQASRLIVETLASDESIVRQRSGTAEDVLSTLAAMGDGIYLVGLDHHTGFLVHRDGRTTFCHSSYLGPVAVTCSDPASDLAFASQYYVFGPALSDAVVTAWLTGTRINTVTQAGKRDVAK